MAATNGQFQNLQALEQGKITVTADYTVRMGHTSDSFHVDNPVVVTDPEDDFTITVPDGRSIGQQLLIVMSSNTNSKTATISVTHHEGGEDGTTSLDAADEFILLIWTGSEWDTLAYSCAADVS